MKWWLNNNIRMVQNNIRDIDVVNMDIQKEIGWLKDIGANCLQIGCGGITAHHITSLDSQWQNPYMKGDFFREILDECHKNGIKVIARFDFSKTHISYLEKRPDWFVRTKDGDPILYNDTVATCVNSEYQEKESLEIIREVLSNYDVDGIFFNMFGYITRDYSGNYFGICQCENCKRKFKEMFGEDLPASEDQTNPVFKKYQNFKRETVRSLLKNIHNLVHSFSDRIAVSTYALDYVDIVRNESNSAVDRPLPHWIYDSTFNCSQITDSFDDKISSNCCINAVDIPYRFMGVSDYYNQMRLYGDIATGSGLDWCIIGNFDDYPDMSNYQKTKEIFLWHKRYEGIYRQISHKNKIMLVIPNFRTIDESEEEGRGIFKMLKEEHLQFNLVLSDSLPKKKLNNFDIIILAGISELPEETIQLLKDSSACVIGTGSNITASLAKELYSVTVNDRISDVRGTYVKTEPSSLFRDFANEEKRWVYLDKEYCDITLDDNALGVLPIVSKTSFGPPERCFGHTETEKYSASVMPGRILIPWNIGKLYYSQGYEEFKRLLLDISKINRPLPISLETNCPEMVEIFLDKLEDESLLLQFINKVGFNGSTIFKPVPLKDLRVSIPDCNNALAFELTDNGLNPVTYTDHLDFELDGIYKAFIIKKGE